MHTEAQERKARRYAVDYSLELLGCADLLDLLRLLSCRVAIMHPKKKKKKSKSLQDSQEATRLLPHTDTSRLTAHISSILFRLF